MRLDDVHLAKLNLGNNHAMSAIIGFRCVVFKRKQHLTPAEISHGVGEELVMQCQVGLCKADSAH